MFISYFICTFLFWGLSILAKLKEAQIDFTSLLFYTLLQILCLALLEGKMDHPFKPYSAYKKFQKDQLLKASDFNFEIRNNGNLILADVMEDYFISKDSEEILSDFLLRKRKSGKINFTKTARNGVSVQPILDFFSKYTDLIEKCYNKEISEEEITTQAEAIKIINEIVLANDGKSKHNTKRTTKRYL